MLKFFLKFIHNFRRYLAWLLNQEGSLGERARGLAVGVFSGCLPLFGFQMGVGILLATFFRGNRLLAATGTWISNPLTYFPLYWFNYQFGCLILDNPSNNTTFGQIRQVDFLYRGGDFIIRLFLGSISIGILLGLLTGIMTYIYLRLFEKN